MHRSLFALALISLLVLTATFNPAISASTAAENNRVYLPLAASELMPTMNLTISAATYLGGTQTDQAATIDVAPDGTVVLGGTLPNYSAPGVVPTTLLGGGNGAIVRIGAGGRTISSITRIGTSVNDLEINNSGSTVICGSFGIAVINATAEVIEWHASPGNVTRCALGSDVAVALAGGTAYVYSSTGTPIGTISVGGSVQNDIAIDSSNGQVIVTGYTQKTSTLQVAWIKAWSYAGVPTWSSYDFLSDEIIGANLGADTRGERLAIGRDGKLYFAGSINGGTGASIFARDPKNIMVVLGKDRNIATDQYNTPVDVGSIKMTWFGRYDPATGHLIQASSLLSRKSTRPTGNSITPRSIMADEAGRVYLVGDTACCIESRDSRRISGTIVGPYELGEAYLLVTSADLRQRLVWTTFTGSTSAGGSPATGVSVRNGTAAVSVNLAKGTLITKDALQPNPATLPDAYIAVWRP